MSPEWKQALHAVDVLTRVRLRLVDGGAVRELEQFDAMTVDELDLLVTRELGLAP